MTLPAFLTYGYVRNGSPTRLVYVNQPAAPVTITGGAGAYWLALMHDTHSAVAGWSRQAGTHYCWQAAATQPADPSGGLVMAGVTVTGANITAVDVTVNYPYQKVAFGGGAGGLAFDKNLTWNGATLHVANVVEARAHSVLDHAGDNATAFYSTLNAAGGTNRWAVYTGGTAPAFLGGGLTVNGPMQAVSTLSVNGATGLGGASVGGYALTAYGSTQLAANVTVGMLGLAATRTFDVNGTARVRQTLSVDGAMDVSGALTVVGVAGFGGAPVGGYSLTVYYQSQLAANVSIGMLGTAATATLDVNGSLRSRGALSCDSTLSVSGNGTFGGLISNGAISASGPITANTTLNVVGHTTMTSLAASGNVTTPGSVTASYVHSTQNVQVDNVATVNYLAVSVESSFARAGLAGYSIACQAIDSGSAVARKIGGGPWSDNSSRAMKRNIADIPDPLGLLLAQRGRRYEWDDERHATALPGPQYGFVHDEVTVEQWKDRDPNGEELLTIRGFEALTVEALRAIAGRLERLERAGNPR